MDFNPKRNDSIARFVCKQIDIYTAHPERKVQVIDKLKEVFSAENESIWSKVIVLNKFRSGFRQIVGITRIKILVPLLKEIDDGLFGGLIIE